MRVIAGKARRINLKTIQGQDTRPTTDRIKETLFNMLQAEVCDCSFLDLFSGSGAIGIEALSRGADHAVFVENNRQAVICIQENLMNTKLKEQGKVMAGDVLTCLRQLEGRESFDIIFMDPPYGKELERQVLEYLKDSSLVHQDTLIIIEADLSTDFAYLEDYGFPVVKRKKYKTNMHMFVKKEEE
jgi:16S rRNA (guanine966-N2)-methyltransferase